MLAGNFGNVYFYKLSKIIAEIGKNFLKRLYSAAHSKLEASSSSKNAKSSIGLYGSTARSRSNTN